MPNIFDKETAEALKQLFSSFPRRVVDHLIISSANEECQTCKDALELANALMEISDGKLEVRVVEKTSDIGVKLKPRYVPAWVFETPGYNVRYYGLPLSQEFPPFIYIHHYIATGKLKIPENIINEVMKIDTSLHVKIFVTPQCPYCPQVVDIFNQIGLVNNRILVETIEAMEFPEEADKYKIFYVPAVIINDLERMDGYVPLDIIVKMLKRAMYRVKGLEIPDELQIGLHDQLIGNGDNEHIH